jgi:hypothetical protein
MILELFVEFVLDTLRPNQPASYKAKTGKPAEHLNLL